MKQRWVIYDDRAKTGSTAGAEALESCASLADAAASPYTGRRGAKLGIVYQYDIVDGRLVNEQYLGPVPSVGGNAAS